MLAWSVAAAADDRPALDPIALARAGTAAIENQRFGDALDAFTRAAALQPGDASLCFGAGVAAFMLGQNDVAQARFERALALNPNYVTAAQWLGDLHYRAGRLQEAISVYETAGSVRRLDASSRSSSPPGARSRSCRAASTNYARPTSTRSSRPPPTNHSLVTSSTG